MLHGNAMKEVDVMPELEEYISEVLECADEDCNYNL